MAKNDGGSAFPATRWDDKIRQEVPWCGMTLRDYFAAKAMQSLILATKDMLSITFADVVIESYAYADAMLVERDNEQH